MLQTKCLSPKEIDTQNGFKKPGKFWDVVERDAGTR